MAVIFLETTGDTMKKFLLKSLIVFGITSTLVTNANAVTLACQGGDTSLEHNLLREDITANCKVVDLKMSGDVVNGRVENFDLLDADEVNMTLTGVGPGIRKTLLEGIIINCPLVFTTDRLVRSNFYGVKAEAGILLGASAGVFVNKRFGACFLTSFRVHSYGVGISASKVKFSY